MKALVNHPRKKVSCVRCGKVFIRIWNGRKYCKQCSKEMQKQYCKKRNKTEQRKQWMRDYYHKKLKDYYKIRHKTVRGKFYGYKSTAKRIDLKFELTLEQFVAFWKVPCKYCGTAISTIGLDRVDNRKGYTVKNIVPCCEFCNKMKLNKTLKQFTQHIIKLYNKIITRGKKCTENLIL